MKRLLSFATLWLSWATLGAQTPPPPGAPASTPAAKATADVPERVKDFGVVVKGQKIRSVFTVRNTGQAPLEISQVRPTCGCTVAEYDHTIPPGASGKVVAEVDTTDFNGPISKSVVVYTNDPDNPSLFLVVKAEVRAYIEVLPLGMVRFNVLQGEAETKKLTLVPSEPADFKVTGVETGGGPYQVSFRQLSGNEVLADKPTPQWEVSVTVPASAPEGSLHHKLTIKTTSPRAPEIPVTVTGVVRPIIQVVPPTVDFGTVPGDAPVGRSILLINNRQGHDLEVPKVEVDDSEFETEVRTLQAGQRYQVSLTLQPGAKKGTHNATLKIHTNDPQRKVLQIPVQVTVQ